MRAPTQSTVHSEQSSADQFDEMETDVDYRSTASPNNDVPSFEELWNADPNTQTPNASQQHQEAGQAATDDFDDDCDDEDIEALLETPEHKLNNNR